MIIKPGNTVVSAKQSKETIEVINSIADKNFSSILYLDKSNFRILNHDQVSICFDFTFNSLAIKQIKLTTPALFQVENCSLALAAAFYLSKENGSTLDLHAIKQRLETSSFPGRMQIVDFGYKKILLDGAHNPQKLIGLIKSLKVMQSNPLTFVISFKKGKDYKKMLEILMPVAKKIYITNFNYKLDFRLKSERIVNITDELKRLNFSNWEAAENPNEALEKAISYSEFVVVTGSFYLIASLGEFIAAN